MLSPEAMIQLRQELTAEMRAVAEKRCTCAGVFHVTSVTARYREDGESVDVLGLRCVSCGRTESMEFPLPHLKAALGGLDGDLEAFRLHLLDVDREYFQVARMRCPCGGKFRVASQALTVGSPPKDVLEIQCVACGRQQSAEFELPHFDKIFSKRKS